MDQNMVDLAKQVMDVSPHSVYSQPQSLNQENIQNKVRQGNFFISSSHDSLDNANHDDKEDPDVLQQINALHPQPLASPHNLNTP